MPDPQPLSREAPKENSLMRHLRDVISDKTGLINSEAISLLGQYDELRASWVALEQERDLLDIKLRDLQRCHVEVLEDLVLECDATPEQARERINQLRATLAQYEAALRECRYALKSSRRFLPSHGTYSEDLINAYEGAIAAANALLERNG